MDLILWILSNWSICDRKCPTRLVELSVQRLGSLGGSKLDDFHLYINVYIIIKKYKYVHIYKLVTDSNK